jgi:tetratricopeptide (TPR) repeat protein
MSEPENQLEQRFPNMRPIRSVPSLSTVNGIGCMLLGGRDHDPETGTYVKTRCFCLLFVPLLSLGAYRVADAPQGGWYFIGREPLSGFARAWNWMLLFLVLGGVGLGVWINHTSSPEYQARKKVAEADRLAEAGEVKEAAKLYREVARGSTSEASPAAGKFKDLLNDPLDRVPLEKCVRVIQMGVEWDGRSDIQDAAFRRGLELAKAKGEAEPRQALIVLELIAPLAEKKDAFVQEQRPLLEKLAAKQPDDIEMLSALAVVCEYQGDASRCERLLAPHRERLGTSEGARVLGMILAHKGQFEEAHALLAPYAETNLRRLAEAQEEFRAAWQAVEQKLVVEVNSKKATDFPYDRYQAAGAREKRAIEDEYLNSHMQGHPDLKAASFKMARVRPVVGVALDLGLVHLGRARAMADPAARKAELEKAEKSLLSVSGAVGGTTEYNLRLGQVYFRMGRQQQGRKLFDEVLDKQGRSFDSLLQVSRLLREIGDLGEARKLAEEAHDKEPDPTKKHNAAVQRAIMATDLDDKVAWLERSDVANPKVKALLASSRSQLALRTGQEEEAARYLREAIDVYAGLPEDATTLNNGALAHHSLYFLTGDVASLDRSGALFEKAVAHQPGDSIILSNLVAHLSEVAFRDLIGKRIDVHALRAGGQSGFLAYLYRDRQGRQQLIESVRQHAGVARALAQAERLVLLAPKQEASYGLPVSILSLTGNVAALRRLDETLREANLDQSDATRALEERLAGKNEAREQEEDKATRARWQKRVEELRKAGGITFAVGATTLALLLMQDETADPDQVVRLTEEAHTAGPSRATDLGRVSALLFRAHRRLIKQNPDYAGMVTRSRRLVGAGYLLALAVERRGKFRVAVLADKDFLRACDLLKEQNMAFPDDPDPWACILLRATHPQEAARMIDALKKDEASRLSRAIALKRSPTSASAALEAYWALKLEGKEAEGKAILKACAARGVPLPVDLN